jgi:hypothetical protein
MVIEKNYIKEVLPSKLRNEINSAIPDIVQSIVVRDDINVNIIFTSNIDTGQQGTIDAIVAAHTTYRSKVKMHRYIKDSTYDPYSVPKEHDYVTGLQIKLYPVRVFDKGELNTVYWYSDIEKTDLIVRTDIIYNRDSLNFVTNRVSIRTWINEDGSDNPDTKMSIKEYTQEEAIAEGVRRRTNVVSSFQQPTIGLMVQYAGYTPTDAVIEGSRFMESISQEINSFIHTPRLNHFQSALTNATEMWLDADIGNAVTIRDYLIDFITISV